MSRLVRPSCSAAEVDDPWRPSSSWYSHYQNKHELPLWNESGIETLWDLHMINLNTIVRTKCTEME